MDKSYSAVPEAVPEKENHPKGQSPYGKMKTEKFEVATFQGDFEVEGSNLYCNGVTISVSDENGFTSAMFPVREVKYIIPKKTE